MSAVMQSVELVPDLVEAARFLEHLAPHGGVTFQTFGDAKRGRQLVSVRRCPPGSDLAPVLANLTALNERGAGVFVMVQATDGGRRATDVHTVRALFVDLDDVNPARDLAAFGLAPSLVVESSPGKHHVYWTIDDLVDEWPLAECVPALQRLAFAFGGDPAVCDLARVLRMPGFVHRKGEPFVSRIVAQGQAYTPDVLRAWLAALPAALPALAAGAARPATQRDASDPLDAATPEALADLRSACAHLVERNPAWLDDRADWIRFSHRMKAAGEGARGLWLEFSARSPKHDPERDPARWDTLRPDRTGYAAIFKDAQAVGWVNPHKGRGAFDSFDSAHQRTFSAFPSNPSNSPPRPLPDELLPVDPFPLHALPDALRPWVADVSERMQCPPDFVAVPMLVAAASLVARRAAIRPQGRTDWTERGNLWALIVGRPGIMKSPAMAQALAPLHRLEARAAETFNDLAAQHRTDALADKLRAEAAIKAARAKLAKDRGADVAHLLSDGDGDEVPTRPRYVVNDLTYEKLGEVLAQNPDGVLSVRDEVRGLLAHLAREESAPARAFYLQAWSGGRYTFDRIGRGTVTVPDARLSVIGGIQPGPLCELVRQARRGGGDDGMIERFLIAWPDSPGEWREVDRWPETAARRAASEAFDRLDALTADALGAERDTNADGEASGLPFLRLDDEAREAFSHWHAELHRELRGCESEGLESALSKFRHHVPALALLLHVADGGAGPVALPAMLRALALGEYFASHAKRLHASGRRLAVRGARLILDKARGGELSAPFTLRDVHQRAWAGLSEHAAVSEALDLLTVHGWLAEAEMSTGGRPRLVYQLAEGPCNV